MSQLNSMIHININGLRTHTEEKKTYITNAQVISIQDTRLREDQDLINQIFPNYV
jgi:exonuclease III